VRSAVDDGVEATRTFVDDVRALGPPETEASEEAGQILDSMTSDVESTADDLSSAFESSGESLQDLIGKVAAAASQLGALASELQSSLSQLEDLQGGELRDAIGSNSDCQTARA
jgi:ABC-type transporter Mla subunit MlaD